MNNRVFIIPLMRTVSISGVKPQKRDVGWHLPHHLASFLELENRFWISHNTPNNTIIQVTINLLRLSSSKEILVRRVIRQKHQVEFPPI